MDLVLFVSGVAASSDGRLTLPTWTGEKRPSDETGNCFSNIIFLIYTVNALAT